MTDETCKLDGQTRAWHEQHQARHSFVPLSDSDAPDALRVPEPSPQPSPSFRLSPAPSSSPTPSFPRDPALRLALIEAGVLTADQLSAAEAKLSAVSGPGGGVLSIGRPAATNEVRDLPTITANPLPVPRREKRANSKR